jgi:preprotein translocase subunit SecE
VAKKTKQQHKTEEASLWSVFWSGFMWPIKGIWRGLAWLTHQFPLKQIGHGLRWFFRLKAVRFLGRILGLTYIRDSWRELRGVTWPTRRESLRLTSAVIIFSVIFGLLIAVVDYGLDKLFRQILIK